MLLQAPERHHDHIPETTTSVAAADASRTVIVGVDGSDGARAAFTAAMERIGPHDTVAVIHAHPPVSGWLGSPFYQRILGELRASVATTHPRVSFEQHEGRPAEVLARLAALRDADEIVVGARRIGRLRGVVGSVARALVRSANRPVLVVPHRRTAA